MKIGKSKKNSSAPLSANKKQSEAASKRKSAKVKVSGPAPKSSRTERAVRAGTRRAEKGTNKKAEVRKRATEAATAKTKRAATAQESREKKSAPTPMPAPIV